MPANPQSEQELLSRAYAMAGFTLAQLAATGTLADGFYSNAETQLADVARAQRVLAQPQHCHADAQLVAVGRLHQVTQLLQRVGATSFPVQNAGLAAEG